MSNAHLIAGPFIGEFGWELFSWQAYLRTLARLGSRVNVFCKRGRAALYQDFAARIVELDIDTTGANTCQCRGKRAKAIATANHDEMPPGQTYEYINPDHTLLFWPPATHMPGFDDQTFIQFGVPTSSNGAGVPPPRTPTTIIVHARERTDIGTNRNWDRSKWDSLCADLFKVGFSIFAIGTAAGAYCPEWCEDERDRPLSTAFRLLSTASLTIGPSSGPMHLASLCGCPHLVWGESGNIPRYEKHWNPLGTKVDYHSGHNWDPPVDLIHNLAINMLNVER
jgi:hypothetical protein